MFLGFIISNNAEYRSWKGLSSERVAFNFSQTASAFYWFYISNTNSSKILVPLLLLCTYSTLLKSFHLVQTSQGGYPVSEGEIHYCSHARSSRPWSPVCGGGGCLWWGCGSSSLTGQRPMLGCIHVPSSHRRVPSSLAEHNGNIGKRTPGSKGHFGGVETLVGGSWTTIPGLDWIISLHCQEDKFLWSLLGFIFQKVKPVGLYFSTVLTFICPTGQLQRTSS